MHKRLLLIAPLALALVACGNSGSSNAPTTPANAAPTTGTTAPTPAATSPVAMTPTPAPAATSASASTSSTAAPAATTTAATTTAAPSDNAMSAAAKAAMVKAAHNFVDTGKWVEGKNYFLLQPQQPKVTATNKVELTEVFNWGCPACNAAHHWVDKMQAALPAYATMANLPAGFRPDENWVLYQRTYYTAKALGLIPKAYDAMFDANWKTGVTGSYNLATGRLNPSSKWPDIHDIAKFFHKKYGVSEKQFVAIANSFAVNTKIKRADKLVKDYGVLGTPSFVVDGRYRFTFSSAGGTYPEGIALAKWLVAKEAHRIVNGQAAQ